MATDWSAVDSAVAKMTGIKDIAEAARLVRDEIRQYEDEIERLSAVKAQAEQRLVDLASEVEDAMTDVAREPAVISAATPVVAPTGIIEGT